MDVVEFDEPSEVKDVIRSRIKSRVVYVDLTVVDVVVVVVDEVPLVGLDLPPLQTAMEHKKRRRQFRDKNLILKL